jgi:small subunit ribosomal protein S18
MSENFRQNSNSDDDIKDEDSKVGDSQLKRRVYMKRKICRFCADKNIKIDYKEIDVLRRFVTEGGKIIPRRISGNCSKHQRILAGQIKLARSIALLPYLKK